MFFRMHSPNEYFKQGVCSSLATWQKKTPLSAFPVPYWFHISSAPLALVQGAENSTGCFSSPSVPRSQWKGSERGKLGMTSTGPSGVWMNISNIWVRAVEDLRVLCESSNHKTSQEPLVLYRWCVLDGNTRGASGTCRGRAGTRSMGSFTGTVGRLFGRSRKG